MNHDDLENENSCLREEIQKRDRIITNLEQWASRENQPFGQTFLTQITSEKQRNGIK
jgi:hypothetical protein